MENKNLWAPWRINYVQSCNDGSECFICHDLRNTEEDDENLVLWRTDKSIVVLNRYPYNNGHLLIAPARHIATLEQAGDDELLEMIKLVSDAQKALSLAISPHGFNVGMNFGRCAGAGLPGHLHIHLVPRWDGDTNFMNVCSDTNVISQSLTELLEILKKVSAENNLPDL
ncbi:HIT domain-containing protein [Planctomycetota bacterium]